LGERGNHIPSQGIAFIARHEQADAPHAVALLRARRQRQRRRAAECGDECSSCNGGGHLPAPVLKPKANDTMIGMVVSSGSHNSIHGLISARGHKHRISVLLSQPLCRKCLQYLPNFVHRSENHQVPGANSTPRGKGPRVPKNVKRQG
jgi:hypothetical protein